MGAWVCLAGKRAEAPKAMCSGAEGKTSVEQGGRALARLYLVAWAPCGLGGIDVANITRLRIFGANLSWVVILGAISQQGRRFVCLFLQAAAASSSSSSCFYLLDL